VRTTSFLIAITCSVCACTSLQPIEPAGGNGSPIAYQAVLTPGDRVRINTADGQTHEFRVSAVYDDRIDGEEISISIDQIVSVETRVFNKGKTAALVLTGVVALKGLADYVDAVTTIAFGL